MRAAATLLLLLPGLLAQQATPEKPATPAPAPQPAKAPDIGPPGPQRTFEAPRFFRIEGKVLMAGGGPRQGHSHRRLRRPGHGQIHRFR